MPTKRKPFFKETSNDLQKGAHTAVQDLAASVAGHVDSSDEETLATEVRDAPPEPTYWQKITINFRRDQVEALQKILLDWEHENDVAIALVELIRLATDEIIATARATPELVWLRAKAQAERELRENPKSKHSKSKSLNIRIKKRA